MKRIGQLMEEIGFRKDAPESVKKAFLEHLFQQASGVPVDQKNLSLPEKEQQHSVPPVQLAFDFAQDSKLKIS